MATDRPDFEDDDAGADSPKAETAQAVAATANQTPVKSQGTTMSTAPAKSTGTKVVTGVIRGSYLHLFTPRPADEEGKPPKYQMTLLIPKTDTATVAKIKAAQEAAITLKWPNKRPAKVEHTMHDGDGVRPKSGDPFGDECKGHWVIAVSSKFKPEVLDRQNNEIIDPNGAMSGDYFKVSINFYAFEAKGNRGTSAGLNNVLLWDKGESLGGRGRAADDFADDLDSH